MSKVLICVLSIDHKHGTDVKAYASEASAMADLRAYVDRWWDHEFGVDIVKPDDPDERVRIYFEEMQEGRHPESYRLEACELHGAKSIELEVADV